jgi:predicted O-methyltransferase YrrM
MSAPKWFEMGPKFFFMKHLLPIKDQEGLLFLQVGAYAGHASEWLASNILTGKDSVLIDIDPWEKHDIYFTLLGVDNIENEYDLRINKYDNVKKNKEYSDVFFKNYNGNLFDFIYVDGDHTEQSLESDLNNSWKFLKVNGILAIDDYRLVMLENNWNVPKSVDIFIKSLNDDEFKILEKSLQVWIKKIK